MQSSSLRRNVAAGITQSFPLCRRWFILQEILGHCWLAGTQCLGWQARAKRAQRHLVVPDPCFPCLLLLYGHRRRTDWWWGLSTQESKGSVLSGARGDMTWRGSVKGAVIAVRPIVEHSVFEAISEHGKGKQGFPKGKLCWTPRVATNSSTAGGWPVTIEAPGG